MGGYVRYVRQVATRHSRKHRNYFITLPSSYPTGAGDCFDVPHGVGVMLMVLPVVLTALPMVLVAAVECQSRTAACNIYFALA
jgi:hypothetical protein